MSGIIGINYLNDRAVESVALEKMCNSLAHRGPDRAGIWCQRGVGLGHRMLWTTPESLFEQLPLQNQNGALVITSDARLDNRDELTRSLGFTNCLTSKITDSELILAAYQAWGEACTEKLLGDFAFAIWDEHKQQLFCARDHVGVKPFYYFYQPGLVFVFASEIKAILSLSLVSKVLNELAVADYLISALEDKEMTFYQNILRLPPAHNLIVSQRTLQIHNYWSLDPIQELRLGSAEEYAEAFRELFTQAVNCRLRSAFPIGSMLSGGLDSSAVTCVARELSVSAGKPPLHTFSYVFDKVPQCDERAFINSVLEQGDLTPHFIMGDQFSPFGDDDKVFWHCDEAFLGPNLYLPWYLCDATKKADIRILLDGADGDTVVSHGYGHLTELAFKGKWNVFAQEAEDLAHLFNGRSLDVFYEFGTLPLQKLAQRGQWLCFSQAVREITSHFDVSARSLYLRQGFKPLIPERLWRYWQKLRGHNEHINLTTSLVNHSFAQRINLKERKQVLESPFKEPALTLREEHWRSLNSGMLPYILELTDKIAAAFSIEFRHPFMDKRLLEFCLALPPEQKLSQGWPRQILRQALVSTLPESVRLRLSKTNLHYNFVYTLLNFERTRLNQLMSTGLTEIEPYVDLKVVRQAYDQLLCPEKFGSEDLMVLWKAVNLTLWLRYTGLSTSR